jgi:3-oxosteroid 1-dehydrogenase
MSGGVIWLPNNPLMEREGVADSLEEGMAHFAAVVGDAGPASSVARREQYISAGHEMIEFLEGQGVRFRRCEGYADYYSEAAGGKPRSRSVEVDWFDGKTLGPSFDRLRRGYRGFAMYCREGSDLSLARRSARSALVAARVGLRTTAGRALGQVRLTMGAGLIARLLAVALRRGVEIWTESAFTDFIMAEDGEVTGVVVRREGRDIRVTARKGVLLSAGGFARNASMRASLAGARPNPATWTSSNPGDTGEVLQAAMRLGAATDLLDDAWWIPSSLLPDGTPLMHIYERSKPGSIIVDVTGARFMNEALPYMEAGQRMYAHAARVPAIPCWLIMDSRHRRRYPFGLTPPGQTPASWLTSGYMRKADTLRELAEQCGIDATSLEQTVARFNEFAASGKDLDFHRGEGAYERYCGDRTNKPNACLGPLDAAPYWAVALYPGDIGTSGGLLCDEHSRVLRPDGSPITGLYASGNTTASVMGRKYPGAGASIGASLIFSYVAAKHATGS